MATLQVYGPLLNGSFEGLLRGLSRQDPAVRSAAATVRIDVIERDNAYVVRAEIPGVAKDDIAVTIEGDHVTIAAERRSTDLQDGERVLRGERYHGAVHRSFVLPVEIDEHASQATYEGGVLELTLAKKVTPAGRKLTIQ